VTAAILVVEGDMANLEGDTPCVRLEAAFLEVTSHAAQLADADQRAVLDLVPLTFAPKADIAQLLVRVVPRAVDRGFDTADLPRVHGRRCGGEGVGDVATEAAVTVSTGEAASGFCEHDPIVRQLLT